MYEKARKRVKITCEKTEDFMMKVCDHQWSALSPYLFTLVMDELTKEVTQMLNDTFFFYDLINFIL